MTQTPVGLEDFHAGATVVSSDGVVVGSLARMIADRETWDVHAVVAKESARFSGHHFAGRGLLEDDVAIPLSAVVSADHEKVVLAMTAAEVRRQAPYLSYQYEPLTGGDVIRQIASVALASPFVPKLDQKARKSADELEIQAGENVMFQRSGKRLGTVRDLVLDDGELVGIVIHPDGFFKEDVLLQVRFLDRSDDAALFAHITPEDLEHLEPFQPQD